MTTDLTGAALLSERYGAPVWLFERSAAARAKASHSTVDAVIDSWIEAASTAPVEEPAPPSEPHAVAAATPEPMPEPAPASPSPSEEGGGGGQALEGAALLAAVAEARGMPESLVERSAQARAGAAGVDLDAVLREWAEEEGLIAPAPTPAPSAAAPPKKASVESAPTKPAAPVAVAAGLSGAALLAAVAEARGMPESLVERSATARAKKTDSTVDDVLNEWAQEAGLVAEPAATEPTPVAAPLAAGLTGAALLTAVAEARGMPESLTERSAKARAKKTDSTIDDVLNEWAQEAGLVSEAAQVEPAPAAAPVAAGLSGAALLTAVAEARGMPESLTERSAKARAKKTDSTVDDVLNQWAQEAGLVTEAAATEPAPSPKDEAPEPVADQQEPEAGPTPAPEPRARRIPAFAVAAAAALLLLLVLAAFALLVDVPSEISELPWYLLGLEPFLGYLDPFIVVVIIPGVVLASLVILAFAAWSPAVKPSLRRLAVMVLALLVLGIIVLTIIGALLS